MPKTIYWNCRWYGWKGLHYPILIHYNTGIIVKGTLIPPPFTRKRFSSLIGFCGSYGVNSFD